LAAGFATGLVGALDAAAFAAVAFEAAAFSAGFAVFLSIALLLFLEGLTADVLAAPRAGLATARVRLLVALRLAAEVLLAALLPEVLEILFLRVFCDTACARSDRAPVQCFHGNPIGAKNEGANRVRLAECAYNSTFPVKINDLWANKRIPAGFWRQLRRTGLN
jgi:hypothetical protein